ncbi:glycosyl hydrolase family 92 protein [Hirsutella rhossiliensis]|uniref:Glycosyl hydrolase family 92 protein n=1 Tax=Hirsutella rhossiliensis TaxID=111463 RepID=A0A9P8MVC1_9HYPO|nr:glycosyl hydrolase family 92 protein [Hirsutella rhossiliensis]KAH0961702.1 glycosyl hydrolase family 92 protein [Hirsutella rhossiliensis]
MAPSPKAFWWLPVLLLVKFIVAAEDDNNGSDPSAFDPLKYVDPLVGAANGGNVFAGATLPYGMAKAVADTNSGSNQGGFTLDGAPVTGFSVMHDSGTGGSPSLGNFPLFAYNSCPGDDVNRCVFPKKARARFGSYAPDSVHARPGYFDITLDGGVRVEMTTSAHAALFRFTFQNTSPEDKPLILQDLTDLSDSRQDNATIRVDGSRITGDSVFVPSFGQGKYQLYFCTDFAGADVADSGIFVNSRASSKVKELKISRSINGYPLPGGVFVREQACSSAETEMPGLADFDRYTQAATDSWRHKLSPVVVDAKGVDESFLRSLYSGIYRTMISPQNYTGENPLWHDGEPYFDSFYCMWDLFRSAIPFLTVIDPDAVAQMGYTQGGSNADNVLADVYQKGIKEKVDWKKGYEAVKKDAEVEPYDWCCQGRGGLDSWNELGYIPVEDFDYKGFGTMTRSVSRTLEYAYNDFCVSRLAAGLGHQGDHEKFVSSSGKWRNLYKNDQPSYFLNGTDTGFTGYFQPKYLNQTWASQRPLLCSNIEQGEACSLQATAGETFESSIWEYGFFVPHAQAELISLYGGADAFVRRLNYIHDNGITYIGNEPAFLTVFQYHYAGRPALSALRSHFYIPKFFAPTPPGLPGNDDSGAMGSFLAFSMLGLFPNPGQNVYLITPPFFQSIRITSPVTGKTATIRNANFDPTYKNIYIQSATLNGKLYTKNWIDHSFFTEGKELVLTLGRKESIWGTAQEDLPPSVGNDADPDGALNQESVKEVDGPEKGDEDIRMGL